MRLLRDIGMKRPFAICVPARNEADRLPALVRSLARQRSLGTAAVRVVVVANNCTDDTIAVLEALRVEHRDTSLVLEIADEHFLASAAHVGTARRMAMEHGAGWLESEGANDGVLLTTDADAVAPPDWVEANLAALDRADLVGGRLRIDDNEDGGDPRIQALHRRIEHYWTAVRALEQRLDPPPHDPDPRHGDHTGASLALSVAQYRRAGGLPALPCGEDNALVTRVRCLGGRVRHCPRVTITVSPRRDGRVAGGMASEMSRRAALTTDGGRYELPSSAHWQALFDRRATLRNAWFRRADGDGDALLDLGLTPAELNAIAPATCCNDIAFVERAMLVASQHVRETAAVDLETGIAGIEHMLRTAAATGAVLA